MILMITVGSHAQFSNYVTITANKFMDGNSEFKPLFLNYVISYSIDVTKNDYFISPHWNYSNIWAYPNTGGDGRYCFSATDDRTTSKTKLANDLKKIKSMGFNVVRIPPAISWSNGNIVYPTGNINTYFNLMDQFLNQLAANGLRAVWVLNADVNSYKYNEQFKIYLDKVSSYFKNNKTIMAYVPFAEPFYSWQKNTKNDKLLIANWSREWYYIMKKNSPNQLITYGLQHPETVINWDPSYMTSDFMSYHFYAGSNDLQYSNNLIASDFKWVSSNYKDTWVMAETGFSGTNITSEQDNTTGTEQQQKDFATFNMQRALDCGCKGYTWWQYQEVNWRTSPTDSYFENHLGLITQYPNQIDKAVVSPFNNYNNLVANTNNCVQPSNYYNKGNFSNIALTGKVVDNTGKALKDAVIVGWKDLGNGKWGMYSTFTDNNGNFNLYADNPNKGITSIWLSFLGYSTLKIDNPSSNTTYTIQPINNNNWMKMWTNDNNSMLCGWTIRDFDNFYKGDFDGDSKDELLCIQQTNNGWANLYNYDNGEWTYNWTNNGNGILGGWHIRNYDKFYVGDFNGDGKDELLCVQNIDGGWVDMYNFSNGQWNYSWSNHGNGWLCGWYIRSGDKFHTGDFDGDGKDELMCIQNYNNGWANMYNFENGDWTYNWTNNGNGLIGEWSIKTFDKFYTGDFNGDGRKELFCVQSTGGSNDWMTSLQFNGSWSRQWSNNGSSSFGIYPYRNKLVVGNFDNDKQDEILGIYTWATKFDFINGDFNWSWSTGSSAKLSDWQVNRNANCFFMKTLKDGPDYLCDIEKKGINYDANFYSMNNLLQGALTIIKSAKVHDSYLSTTTNNVQTTESVKLYPNPNNGIFKIEIDSRINDQVLIDIYNEVGVNIFKSVKSVTNGNNIFEIDQSTIPSGLYFVKMQSKNINNVQKISIRNY